MSPLSLFCEYSPAIISDLSQRVKPIPEADAPTNEKTAYLERLFLAMSAFNLNTPELLDRCRRLVINERNRLAVSDQAIESVQRAANATLDRINEHLARSRSLLVKYQVLAQGWGEYTHNMWALHVDKLCRMMPEVTKLAYPRRYELPGNYTSPKVLTLPVATAVCALTRWCDEAQAIMAGAGPGIESAKVTAEHPYGEVLPDTVEWVCLMSKLVEMRVPTYFVGEAMARAVANTDLPKDFALRDVDWPLDAVLFALPNGAVKAPRGEYLVQVAVGKLDAGSYTFPNVINDGTHIIDRHVLATPECHVLAISSTGRLFAWKSTMDATSVHDAANTGADTICNVEDGSDIDFTKEVVSRIGLQLLLVMAACPDRVEKTSRVVKPKLKVRGEVIAREIWSPNFFGRRYAVKTATHDGASDGASDGRKMPMHWRRGHLRNQRFGAGRTQTKVVWIEPVCINPGNVSRLGVGA